MQRLYVYLLGLVLVLMLAGCTEFEVETHLNADGSGFRRVAVAVDERAYQLVRQQELDPLVRLRALGEQIGARVEPYQPAGKVGLRVAKEFNTLEELLAWSQAGVGEKVQVSREEGVFTTRYRYEATLDSSQYDVTSFLDVGPQAGQVELRYVLELPGAVLEHNATEQHGNRLIWVVDPVTRAQYNLYAVYRVPNMRNVWIAVGAGAAAGLVFLISVALWIRRSIRGF
jgi:hypothetical protein